MSVCVYIIHIYIYVCVYVDRCVCVSMCYVYVYVCMYECVCTYVRTSVDRCIWVGGW